MKILSLVAVSILLACNSNKESKNIPAIDSSSEIKTVAPGKITDNNDPQKKDVKVYANDRFRQVTIAKVGADNYLVKGEAQVFEAAFSWVIIQGNREVQNGHVMSDAGAPAWGRFEINLKVSSADTSSGLHLLLFESSPKDGSRQHQLSIPLEV